MERPLPHIPFDGQMSTWPRARRKLTHAVLSLVLKPRQSTSFPSIVSTHEQSNHSLDSSMADPMPGNGPSPIHCSLMGEPRNALCGANCMDLFCPHTAPTPKIFSGQWCIKGCGHMSSFLDRSIGLRMTAFDLDFCLSQKALALDRSATERRMGDGLDLALDLQSREGTRSVGREI